MKATKVIALLCYALFAAVWIADVLTPQQLIVAILLNGPIALSAVALRPGLTTRLIVLAEIGNVVAAYANGVAAGGHWDAIVLADRALLAASFLLVGALTISSQRAARAAGEAGERARRYERERALRESMERVRASLNMEFVLRAAVREARHLGGADRAAIAASESALEPRDLFEMRSGEHDVRIRRGQFEPELRSLLERARERGGIATAGPDEPLARFLGEAALAAVLAAQPPEIELVMTWREGLPDDATLEAIAVFVDNLAVAVEQARLFIRLAEQNDAIAQAQRDVEERSSIIRDLVYALAHDLRTPLAAADMTMTQALGGAYGALPERYRDVLRSSVVSNADLRRLVETLLLVARYEAGEDARAIAPQRIDALLRRVADEMEPIARSKGIALECAALDPDCAIDADGDELRRAVTNLVANALDATPRGGHVWVSARVQGDAVTIAVEDDGFGVPPERRAALFQRFAGIRSGGGTGLGLYIVRRIAEKYGGQAKYEPREPRGSRFTLVLPRTQSAS